jgi:hypothetical protein
LSGTSRGTDFVSQPIAPLRSKEVVWKAKSLGSLHGVNYLPTALIGSGCILELTFVDTADEVCDTTLGVANAKVKSDGWNVTGMSLICDTVTADGAFVSSLGGHLGGGGSLQMRWKSYSSSFYSILGQSAQESHSRSNSRLDSLFVTFIDRTHMTGSSKACNRFYIPINQALRSRVTIGDRRWPDSLDNSSVAMHFHRLLHCIGAANSTAPTPALTSESYSQTGYILAQDLSSTPSQSDHSGTSTYGATLTVFLEGLGSAGVVGDVGGGDISGCYLILYHDVLMEISMEGVVVAT